jgi:hypothetical protein
MAETGKIYAAISGVMAEIGAIGKEKKNLQQGFMYRGIDDVMNALQPLLVKHGVFVVPEVLEQTREERVSAKGNTLLYSICKIRYTFFAADGSNVVAVTVGEGMDSGDKATNKAMAIALKYACFQVFCIPTEEMGDPDAASPKLAAKQKPPVAAPKPNAAPPASDVITEAQRKRMFALSGDDAELCKSVINSFGYASSKDVKRADYEKICADIEKFKNNTLKSEQAEPAQVETGLPW